MLLVLKPLTFISLTVGEGVDTEALAFAFYVLAVELVAVGIFYLSFAVRFTVYHFTLILSSVIRLARTK